MKKFYLQNTNGDDNMTCYAVPTTAAIIHYFLRKKIPSWNTSKYHSWLNQLLLGGAIFGVVDHWWHGELFLIGDNIVSDLLLGLIITVTTFIVAGIMVVADKLKVKQTMKFVN
ncbi:MAG: hypothetical protein ABIB43_04685 [archaeon]